ncbi:TapY2 family type IVa secretion system protein [Shewanella sp. 1CM18E]|uniref:TapY2 family type IVa secretion system protein n=1 Tax=Shewanella sp. 1CM18E TaxID=2929169 RepID=UPI0020BF2CBD|nr:TapY2 family type IVa secretion system protein [Shewanella sp. 1CM18E]MCK8043612.1 TapY2 family type IVa secretion system protein [Shewanella sp. 1CM18E]
MMRYIPVILMLLTTAGFAESTEKQEYKCHVITSVGDQVTLYRWPVGKMNYYMQRLPMKKVPKSGPGRRPLIKEVVECVESDVPFSTAVAQKLDANLAR